MESRSVMENSLFFFLIRTHDLAISNLWTCSKVFVVSLDFFNRWSWTSRYFVQRGSKRNVALALHNCLQQ